MYIPKRTSASSMTARSMLTKSELRLFPTSLPSRCMTLIEFSTSFLHTIDLAARPLRHPEERTANSHRTQSRGRPTTCHIRTVVLRISYGQVPNVLVFKADWIGVGLTSSRMSRSEETNPGRREGHQGSCRTKASVSLPSEYFEKL